MAVRPFVMWPDPRLRAVAKPVAAVTDEVRTILQDMADTMYAMPGFGLAGPQIGVCLRLAVVDCSDGRDRVVKMINPEILASSPQTFDWTEASPNLPGVSVKLSRPATIEVAYTDTTGMRVRKTFEKLWATSVQHQIDHLDGKLFVHRVGKVKRDILIAKSLKSQKARG